MSDRSSRTRSQRPGELTRTAGPLEDLVPRLVAEVAGTYRSHAPLLRVFVARSVEDARLAEAGDREISAVALEFEDALLAHAHRFSCNDPRRAAAMCFQVTFDAFQRLVLFGGQAHPELDWDQLVGQLSAMCLAYLLTPDTEPHEHLLTKPHELPADRTAWTTC